MQDRQAQAQNYVQEYFAYNRQAQFQDQNNQVQASRNEQRIQTGDIQQSQCTFHHNCIQEDQEILQNFEQENQKRNAQW